MRPEAILSVIGERLAAARKAADLSLQETARRAGVSSRYLRTVEAGDANVSVLKLASIAGVLRLPLRELCDINVGGAPDLRLALLGVRGAGKSTVGRALAQSLEVPFFELDALIEERAGLELGRIFSMYGEAHYRKLQRETLEDWLSHNGSGVLATGGSIVEDEDTFRRLREACRTVFLHATPEAHWERVVEQGDTRPMRNNPRAIAVLPELVDPRARPSATADRTVETTGRTPAQVVADISSWVLD